jgi:hypothetical protein
MAPIVVVSIAILGMVLLWSPSPLSHCCSHRGSPRGRRRCPHPHGPIRRHPSHCGHCPILVLGIPSSSSASRSRARHPILIMVPVFGILIVPALIVVPLWSIPFSSSALSSSCTLSSSWSPLSLSSLLVSSAFSSPSLSSSHPHTPRPCPCPILVHPSSLSSHPRTPHPHHGRHPHCCPRLRRPCPHRCPRLRRRPVVVAILVLVFVVVPSSSPSSSSSSSSSRRRRHPRHCLLVVVPVLSILSALSLTMWDPRPSSVCVVRPGPCGPHCCLCSRLV